jgi:hypothetical protein
MQHARRLLATMAALTAAGLSSASAPAAPPQALPSKKATLATFAGAWAGHTRGLKISRGGRAREFIDDGCCDQIIRLQYKLSRVQGTATRASARIRVTRVRVLDRSAFSTRSPAPHRGQTSRLTLRHGVITDHLFVGGVTYCDYAQQLKGTCGA